MANEEFILGTAYDKGKSDVNECIYVPAPIQFGLFCTIDPTTKHPIISPDGTALYIAGWDDGVTAPIGNTEHFWTTATGIYVQSDAGIVAGDPIYVKADGTGIATNDPSLAGSGFTPVGIALLDSRQVFTDRSLSVSVDAVKINWTYISAPVSTIVPPPPLKATKKSESKKEVI